jgi:hypothetical protein
MPRGYREPVIVLQALQFVDRSKLKIIYHGKVLYPPPLMTTSITNTTTAATTIMTSSSSSQQQQQQDELEWVIAKKLLENSKHDLTLAGLKKPSLVMGTRLADLQRIQQQSKKQDTHNNNFRWWHENVLRLPISVLTVLLQVSWLMIGTFVTPLLPHTWTEHWRRTIANHHGQHEHVE